MARGKQRRKSWMIAPVTKIQLDELWSKMCEGRCKKHKNNRRLYARLNSSQGDINFQEGDITICHDCKTVFVEMMHCSQCYEDDPEDVPSMLQWVCENGCPGKKNQELAGLYEAVSE